MEKQNRQMKHQILRKNRNFLAAGATFISETFLYNHGHFSHLTFIEKFFSRQSKTLQVKFTDKKKNSPLVKGIKISPLSPLK